jgi:hypothetical protein
LNRKLKAHSQISPHELPSDDARLAALLG